MWFWLGLGVVIVLMLGAALIVDLKDRTRAGERRVRMPGWFDRRARGQLRMSPINWDTTDDRAMSPREEEDERRV